MIAERQGDNFWSPMTCSSPQQRIDHEIRRQHFCTIRSTNELTPDSFAPKFGESFSILFPRIGNQWLVNVEPAMASFQASASSLSFHFVRPLALDPQGRASQLQGVWKGSCIASDRPCAVQLLVEYPLLRLQVNCTPPVRKSHAPGDTVIALDIQGVSFGAVLADDYEQKRSNIGTGATLLTFSEFQVCISGLVQQESSTQHQSLERSCFWRACLVKVTMLSVTEMGLRVVDFLFRWASQPHMQGIWI